MIKFKTFQVASENTTLQGRKYFSDQIQPKRNIIISHGFSSSMNNSLKFVNPLVKIGCQVYIFNFKQYDNDTNDTSILTEKQNLISIVKFVKKYSNIKRIDLLGCSQGGLVSALVANDYSRLINKLALFYPAFSIPNDFKENDLHQGIKLHGIKFNYKYILDAKKLDPWNQIMHYQRPVLLCHGNKDQLVNIKYSKRAHSIYKNSKLVTIKNGDHGFKQNGFNIALKALVEFIKM